MQEPLANQPEQSHEIQCKPCTITAPVCKYFPCPPVGGHAYPRTGEPGQVLSLERYTGLFEGVHFPVLLVCITSLAEKLCPTRMELSWLSPLFNAGGVPGIDRQHCKIHANMAFEHPRCTFCFCRNGLLLASLLFVQTFAKYGMGLVFIVWWAPWPPEKTSAL